LSDLIISHNMRGDRRIFHPALMKQGDSKKPSSRKVRLAAGEGQRPSPETEDFFNIFPEYETVIFLT